MPAHRHHGQCLHWLLVYAAAGLLPGRPATTHWGSLDSLAAADPTIQIRPDDRFVDDGDVITSAGVSAGSTRPAFGREVSPDPNVARQVRRGFSTTPEPPV